MAVCSSLPPPTLNSLPRSKSICSSSQRNKTASVHFHVGLHEEKCSGRSGSVKKLNASGKLAEIEPDLNEDPHDRWATNGISPVRCRFLVPNRKLILISDLHHVVFLKCLCRRILSMGNMMGTILTLKGRRKVFSFSHSSKTCLFVGIL